MPSCSLTSTIPTPSTTCPRSVRRSPTRPTERGIADRFPDPHVRKSIEIDRALIDYDDQLLNDLERAIVRMAKQHDANTFYRLRSIPGVGKILALTLLYEIHSVDRFPRVQDFVSYARLVKCARESAGNHDGHSGKTIGNVHLKGVFSEIAVRFLRQNPAGQDYVNKLASQHGKPKALSILAHKLGRAVYFMLKRQQAFDRDKFLTA